MPQNKTSRAQMDAVKRHRNKIYQITTTVPIEQKDAIQARAAMQGKSVNAYVTDLIWRDLYGENGGKAESSEKARKAEKAESYQKGK